MNAICTQQVANTRVGDRYLSGRLLQSAKLVTIDGKVAVFAALVKAVMTVKAFGSLIMTMHHQIQMAGLPLLSGANCHLPQQPGPQAGIAAATRYPQVLQVNSRLTAQG